VASTGEWGKEMLSQHRGAVAERYDKTTTTAVAASTAVAGSHLLADPDQVISWIASSITTGVESWLY